MLSAEDLDRLLFAINERLREQKCLMEKVGVRDMDHVYEILGRYIPRQLLTPRVDYFAQAVFSEYINGQNAGHK